MSLLGRIVRIQVQRAPLKVPHGYYEPDFITPVPEAILDHDGVLGRLGDEQIVDAHHRRHPRARGGGTRALSIGFTGHYAAMAERFGARASLGIAGENLVVEGPPLRMADLEGGVEIHTAGGAVVALPAMRPATPCREFTSFLLGYREPRSRDEIAEELAFLSEGTRGFIVDVEHLQEPVDLTVGDAVYLA